MYIVRFTVIFAKYNIECKHADKWENGNALHYCAVFSILYNVHSYDSHSSYAHYPLITNRMTFYTLKIKLCLKGTIFARLIKLKLNNTCFSVTLKDCQQCMAQLTGAIEYTDCFFAEQGDPLPHECTGYDAKQSDVEVLVMLELCGMQSKPSLLSLPDPLTWSGSTW